MTSLPEHSLAPHLQNSCIEICISYRFAQENSWVVQGITGFLSAYYMERPGFQVRKHFDELETGMHIWICEVPFEMNIRHLLKRLQCDLPPSSISQTSMEASQPVRYLIDTLES